MWDEKNIVFDNNICRLCGCNSDNMYNIESNSYPGNNDGNTIEMMIKRLIPLKIEVKDRKPQQVCHTCINSLESYDTFISMCLTTDATFNNILKNIKASQCENKDSFDNRNIIWMQDSKVKSSAEQNSILLLRNENSSVQNQDFYLMVELNYKGVEIDPLLIKCNENNRQPNTPDDNVKPVELSKDESSESQPVKKKEKLRPFKCNVCNKSLTRKSNLITHLTIHSNERPYKCTECNKEFAVSTDLNLHKHIHTGLFTCDVCNKRFVTKSKLERHKRSHTGIKEHACSICKKTFAEKNNMIAHMTVHTGERPFSCTICKKSFRTQSHLTDHKKVHSSDTPYKCLICSKSFKWKSNLKDHNKFHSGEKFKCVNCHKEFNIRTDYYKHRKVCREKEKEEYLQSTGFELKV